MAVLFLSTYDVLHSVGGGLGLRLILDVGQDDSSAALDCLTFLCIAGSHALEPVAGVGLLGQAAFLDHNGRIGLVNPCGAVVGIAGLHFAVHYVTHGVAGILGLCFILHIGQGDDGTAGNCITLLGLGVDALEPVADVGLLLQAARLDHNGRIGLVNPCGTGVGVAVLFLSTYDVLHSVVGGLGLACILYIVQHHHISLSADFQRLRLCGIKFITGNFDSMISCVHRSAQCLIGNQHLTAQLIVRTLLQIPHSIAQIRPFRPDRVQVCALFRDVDGIPGEIGGCAVLGCGPADENVAGGGGEAQLCRRLYCCKGVGADVSLSAGVRSVVVSQPDRGRRLGVHGDEGHVTAHLHGLTGLIDLVGCRVLPEQEPQVAILRSQDCGVAAALIGVVVLRARLVAFYVGNLEGFQRSGEVGHQSHGGIELGIRVEQRLCAVAVHGEPGAGLLPVIAGSDLFHQFRVAGSILQGRAIGNAQRFSHTVDVDCQINGCVDLGGRPLGIEGDVLGGHGLAIELEGLALTGLVIIPTSKLVTRRHTVRPGGFIAYIAQGLLILQRQRPFRGAVVDEDNVVTVAGVVEFGVIIPSAVLRSLFVGKSGNGIFVFL